jgi:hypothetical protein
MYVPFWTGNFLSDRKRDRGIPWPPSLGLTPLDVFCLWFVKDSIYHQSAQYKWDVWQNHQSCRVRYQLHACKTKYCLYECHASNGAHIKIYWACKILCMVQCFKTYWFLQYTLWLKMYNVLFYFITI